MTKFLYKKHKVLGNKGFSLVELIIVIAIMAILVAILAPQYLKYVDKSRQSADDTNADQLLKAVQVYMADETNSKTVTADATITMNSTNTTLVGGGAANTIVTELNSAMGSDWQTKKVTSSAYKNGTVANHAQFIVDIDFATGVVTGAWSA